VTDPIVLDLGQRGINLTSLADPVSFDLNADGTADLVGWTSGEDGILALDLNGSGAIDNGREIFSPFFNGGGFRDSLQALASLDGDGNGVIDAQDHAFASVLVWTDSNHDGLSAANELASLASHGIGSIDLQAQSASYEIGDQQVVAEGTYTLTTGQTGDYVAVDLDHIPMPTNTAATADFDPSARLQISGDFII
jgi:hypothetical protein